MKRSLIFQIELPSLSAADSISLIVLFQANRIWGRPHIFYSAACSGANISIRKKSRSVKYKNCAQRSRSSVAWRMNLETWGSFIVTSMEAGNSPRIVEEQELMESRKKLKKQIIRQRRKREGASATACKWLSMFGARREFRIPTAS